ncbi:hypothetical protein [Saccharopolyspora hattusasensis]|uniref:hypothetical protein n=1 Tax=Saccharopolyspora hattusasensis TaxID=1128679 RepID=UPI003D97D466
MPVATSAGIAGCFAWTEEAGTREFGRSGIEEFLETRSLQRWPRGRGSYGQLQQSKGLTVPCADWHTIEA